MSTVVCVDVIATFATSAFVRVTLMAQHTESSSDEPRRSFLVNAAAAGTGAVAGLVPACAGAVLFLDPLLRKKQAADPKAAAAASAAGMGEGYLPITKVDSLPADGSPRAFKVIADLQDAWNKFPQTEIGSVYLSRSASGEISCFNARCPHLGCTVQYKDGEQKYACPCHDSAFELNGARLNEIPPRGMDSLEAKAAADGMIWVKFLKFRAGTAEKKPV